MSVISTLRASMPSSVFTPSCLLALVIVSVTGCQTAPLSKGIRRPTVRVSEVKLLEQSDEGARVQVTVAMSNPNRVPLPIESCYYNVTLAGGPSFSYTDHARLTLPANGYQQLVLPAAFATDGGDVAGRGFRVSGSVSYHPPGKVRRLLTESGVPLPKANYRASGKLQ